MYSSTISAVIGTGMFSSFIFSGGILGGSQGTLDVALGEALHLAEGGGEADLLAQGDHRLGHGHAQLPPLQGSMLALV